MTVDRQFFDRGLKLSHLRLLSLLASLGQVRKVAEHLSVTQPAVSKQLAELQSGLGGRVVTRVGNRLEFTATGEALVKHAREVLHQLEQARHEVDALSKGLSGSLTIGGVATVLPVLATALVLQIKNRAPNLDISIVSGTSDRLFPLLAKGEIDLLFSRTPPPAALAGLNGKRVFKDPIVIVCGRQNPLAARPRTTPADIDGMPWILPSREAPAFIALNRWMQRHRLRFPPGCVQSTSLLTSETLVQAYPFLALLSRSRADSLPNRDKLKVLRLAGSSFLENVWVFSRRAAPSPVIRAALESVEAMKAALPDGAGRSML